MGRLYQSLTFLLEKKTVLCIFVSYHLTVTGLEEALCTAELLQDSQRVPASVPPQAAEVHAEQGCAGSTGLCLPLGRAELSLAASSAGAHGTFSGRGTTTRNTSAAPEAPFVAPGTVRIARRCCAAALRAALRCHCGAAPGSLYQARVTPGSSGSNARCVPAALRTREEKVGTQLSPPPHNPAPVPQRGRAPPRRSFRPPPGTERPPDGEAPQGEAGGGARGTACGAFAALRGDPRGSGSGPALGAYRAAASSSSSFPRLRGAARREGTGPDRAGPHAPPAGGGGGAEGRARTAGSPPPPRPVPPLAGGTAALRVRQPSHSGATPGPWGRVRSGAARAPIGGPGSARASQHLRERL